MCILKNDSEGTAQVIFSDFCNVDAVIKDLTALNVVETIDQVGDRCLTGACRSYECQLLARFGKEADIMKNNFVFIVSKCHIFESYISGQFSISHSTIFVSRLFPCPHTGTFCAFSNRSILIFFCIDQCDRTGILFRFFVNELKDTFCSCKSHDDGIELLCNLHEWLGKALCKLQVRSDDTDGNTAHTSN